MKIVPFYPNEEDNLHCLQACVKSVLDFFNVDYSNDNVDEKTGFFNVPSWSPHAVVWMKEKGLNVNLVSPFDYQRLSNEGEAYIKSFKHVEVYEKEKLEGQYNQLDEIQKASKEMTDQGLWVNKRLSVGELADFLKNDNKLAIAKTIHDFLSGNAVAGFSHYVTVIKQYQIGKWLIHDPGSPPIERRKVDQSIRGVDNIFGDVILISK